MDNFTIIRNWLYNYVQFLDKEEKKNNLEEKCGIISSCYPPNEMYPDGIQIKYPFPIKPKDANRYYSL